MSSSTASTSSSTRANSKRQRATSPTAEVVEPTPSPTYFYEDGNVLLHVGQTLYKVHRSIVSQAEVLRDTLLVGTADAGSSNGSGREGGGELATIRLDDAETEVDVFLKAMYDSLSFVHKMPLLGEIRSLLRLADKYNHPAILSTAERSFESRIKEERSRWLDRDSRSLRAEPAAKEWKAILSIAQELDVLQDASIWCHEALASIGKGRAPVLFDACEVEGMTVSLSTASLREVVTRIDVKERLFRELQWETARHITHTPTCEASAQATECSEETKSFCQDLFRIFLSDGSLRASFAVRWHLDRLINDCETSGRSRLAESSYTCLKVACLDQGLRAYLVKVKGDYLDGLDKMCT